VALLAVGVLLLPVGEATGLKAEAQTAADAAALAGVQRLERDTVQALSSQQVPLDQVSDALVDAAVAQASSADPCGPADTYAGLNGATVLECDHLGNDVLVKVATIAKVANGRSEAESRASLTAAVDKAALALAMQTTTTTTTVAGQAATTAAPVLVDPSQYVKVHSRLVPVDG
jgi:hypothetical protein